MTKITLKVEIPADAIIEWLDKNGYDYILHKHEGNGGYIHYESDNKPREIN